MLHVVRKLKPHTELIAALISGLLVLVGWYVSHLPGPASIILYVLAFIIGGYAKAKEGIEDTIKEKDLNVEMLMVFAAIGSAVIGYWAEGAILIFIFSLSGALETYTMNKSKKEITALMDLQPDKALKVFDGKEELVSVTQLVIGDLIVVKAGERIPVDGTIESGTSSINEAAISGESVPVLKGKNAEVFAGTVNVNGLLTIKMTKPSDETLVQKILKMVQTAQSEKSPSQQFIEKFEGVYVKGVIFVVILMMFVPHMLFDWSWSNTFYRAMVLLVVASPCALVASIMPATLSAISNGARNGILFKGGIHLESLHKMRAVAFDKTGTLTQGKPEVTDVIVREGVTKEQFLSYVGAVEKQSNHPLAQAIVAYSVSKNVMFPVLDSVEETAGLGVEASLNGTVLKIGKSGFVNKAAAHAFYQFSASTLAEQGKTVVFVEDDKGILGLIALKDTVRKEAIEAIKLLKRLGIYTTMLTGDNERTAEAIAKEVGIDGYIAECLPEEKLNHIVSLQQKFQYVAMVGDGINDAPALATADIGIAMGEGTDVALETADVVLMKNDLTRLADAVKLSRKMQSIVKQNMVFSIGVIVLLIASNFLQVIELPFGVVGHEGSTILVILNGLRLLTFKGSKHANFTSTDVTGKYSKVKSA